MLVSFYFAFVQQVSYETFSTGSIIHYSFHTPLYLRSLWDGSRGARFSSRLINENTVEMVRGKKQFWKLETKTKR